MESIAMDPTVGSNSEELVITLGSDLTTMVNSIMDKASGNKLNGIVHSIGREIGLTFHLYYVPFMTTFGLIGNVLTLLVLSRTKTRDRPLSKYMMALAVADCVMLVVAAHHWVRAMIHKYIFDSSVEDRIPSLECKIGIHLLNAASLTGAFYIMAMTFAQFICVKFPLHSASICTPSRAKKIIIIIPVAVIIYCIPQFLYAASVRPTCIGMNIDTKFSIIYSWITVSLNSFVPFVVVFTLNLFIILELRKHAKKVIGGHVFKSVREKQSLNSLLMINFVYLLLTLPLHIRYIYYQYNDKYASLKTLSDFFLAYHFTTKLFYTNSAINFCLYTCGGSKFRQDFKALLCSCFGRRIKKAEKSSESNAKSMNISSTAVKSENEEKF